MTAGALLLALLFPSLQEAVETHFSPTGEARLLEKEIIQELDRARTSISVAVFHFTSRRLAYALQRRARAGIRVRILMDERQSDPKFVRWLRERGLDVRRVVAKGNDRARFHHKYCVVDDTTVMTGSYNWTVMGDIVNHENVVILRRRATARAFAENFESTWNDGSLSRP